MSTSVFSAWLQAPFLKELTGKQLYDLIVSIKELKVTGECECYAENGNAFVLEFLDGTPRFDREKIAAVLKRPSIVAAWMPGKVSGAADALPAEVVTQLQGRIDSSPCFRADDHWIVLLRNTTQVASSDPQAPGVNLATGLVAELNGAFKELTDGRPLQRFSLDLDGIRFSFQTLGGDWSAVVRANSISQPDVLDCTRGLRRQIAELELDRGDFDLRSRATEPLEANYCLVRPRLYQQVEERFRRWLTSVDAPWNAFWFQYDDDVVYRAPIDGDPEQERDGAIATLNSLIRHGFERLTTVEASNFVLYADGITVWCDYFAEGFWVSRFADDTHGYRRIADQAKRQGYELLREVFGAPGAGA